MVSFSNEIIQIILIGTAKIEDKTKLQKQNIVFASLLCFRSFAIFKMKLFNINMHKNAPVDGRLFKVSDVIRVPFISIVGLFNLRGSDIDFNPVFFSYAIVTTDDVRLVSCIFLLRNDFKIFSMIG